MFEKLERLILRYRTNEMMRLMFHTEDLRKYLVASIKASNLWIEESDDRYFNNKAKVMPQVWKRLLNDEVLSGAEVEDLKKIIDKRNTIAHEVQNFTRDLHVELKDYSKVDYFQSQYDYGALKRLLEYKKKIQRGWKGISSVSFRCLHFDFADKMYTDENVKLLKQIDHLYSKRVELVSRVNNELAKYDFRSNDEDYISDINYRIDGSLSSHGGKTCRNLLNKGLSIHAVSLLMDIDLDRVKYQKRKISR